MSDKKDLLKSLFLTCIAIGIIFLAIVNITYKKNNPSTSSTTREYDGWYTMLNNKQKYIDRKAKINTSNGESIIYNVLPEMVNNNALLFRTYHQKVEVIVEGQVIYQYGNNIKLSFGKSPGSAYHIVNLDNSYAGKNITIKYNTPYASAKGKIFDVYIGPPEELIMLVVSENLFSLLINVLLFIFGIAFLLIACIFGRKLKTKQTLYVGIFALLFSVCSLLQSCVIQLFMNHYVILMFVEYVAFLLIPISIVLYVRELFKLYDDKGIKLLVTCLSINFIICIVLQLTRMKDIKEMLPVLHFLIIAGMIYLCILLYKMHKNLNNLISRRSTSTMCAVFFLSILIDIFRYYNNITGDGSKFTRFGVLILISYMLLNYVQEYINKSKEYTEARLMAKLAYKDVMTGLFNRTAYAEDTADYEKQLYLTPNELNLIYVIFDLNNLKVMNDFHGHSVGDYYIITTGKIIKKAFEKIGKCYRIGGDEFAVIIKDKNLGDFYKAIKELKKQIIQENETADLEYSLAFGYAIFESGKYSSLNELINTADKNMYENKNIYKENRMSTADFTP